jgi:tyrosyl-tRNA synthetase
METEVIEVDTITRYEIIKGIGEEIITEVELKQLLETKANPIAYDGFEPSGKATLPVGIYKPLLIKQLSKAGVRFKLLLADSFAWLNNKLGGDLERIREAGKYFVEVWKAAGLDTSKVEIVWHKDLFDDPEYWKKVILIAKSHSLTRTKRSLAVAGRKEDDSQPAAFVFYPSMQCADIFHLGVDICQLGLDQRKVNVLAREIAGTRDMAELLGYADKGANGKPVVVSHHMLLGLGGPKDASGYDEDVNIDKAISSKMSKSIPNTAIFVHDNEAEIRGKIEGAFCPPRVIEGNPIIDYTKEIIFRAFDEFEILRPRKFGGDVVYTSFEELKRDYVSGKLHPADLKQGVIEYLERLIKPVREHFEKDRGARRLYENVNSYEVTRQANAQLTRESKIGANSLLTFSASFL